MRLVLLVMTMLCATPVAILTLLVPRWSNLVIHVGRFWSRTMLATSGAHVTVHGHQHTRTHAPCIFIANHQSIVDVWVMLSLVPPNTRFAAKHELFRIPVLGWALANTGCIPINRGNRTEAIRSLGVAAERIRTGRSVVLYPEGTRSRDGSLQPFKKGAFHLAVQAGVPIVPVAITGSFDVVPPGRLRVTPGPVEVFIEPPIDVTPYQPGDHAGLLRVVHASIARRFHDPTIEREKQVVPQESS
jgi:1-acyl-sn-glycerol-3-phosphate acyltransferase